MGEYIGIDLGTTCCCTAVYSGGESRVVLNSDQQKTTPSYVAFAGDRRFFGMEAKSRTSENISNTIFEAKRFIGRRYDDPEVVKMLPSYPFEVVNENGNPSFKLCCFGEERLLTPEQISAMLLENEKKNAEATLKMEISEVVVTVPAYFDGAQRQATVTAAELAGLKVLRLLNEPTAAILAYGLDKHFENEPKNVLVFDLGGGTFDITVVRCSKDDYTVLSTCGDSLLGGRDFDLKLAEFLETEVERQCGKGLKESKVALNRFHEACISVKHTLSTQTIAKMKIDRLINGNAFELDISRSRFEALNEELFESTLNHIGTALEDAKLDKNNIDYVLLVGGSSKIPKIRENVRNYFPGVVMEYNGDPEILVARGAAIQAALIKKSGELKALKLRDVCPLSLGIGAKDDVMSVMIKRNTPIPCEVRRQFRTTVDNQTAITCKVYEGERPLTKFNNFLGKFILDGITEAPKGEHEYEVILSLDEDGILTVREVEVHTGHFKEMKISQAKGRYSPRDLQAMLNDMKRFKERDEKEMERIKTKQDFEEYLEEIAVNSTNNNALQKAVKEARTWLNQNWKKCSHEEISQKWEEFKVSPAWKQAFKEQNEQR